MITSAASILFVAGDPSGDEHASHIVSQLKKRMPHLECFGIGGPCMEKAGFKPLLPFAPFNKMGVGEVLANISFFTRARQLLADEMSSRKPRLVVPVDYAGFNIGVMKKAQALGIPVLWYIPPKVWAWKKKRAKILGNIATSIACILPFEPRHFEGYSARAFYAGNPCMEELLRKYPDLQAIAKGRPQGRPWRIALVPGSRPQEIRRIFGSMAAAGNILRDRYAAEIRVSAYHGLDRSLFSPHLENYHFDAFSGPLDELLAWADLAMVTSGTATLQAALMEVPHVLVYKMSLLNHLALRMVIKLPFIGLPNIIAGKQIIRECLQHDADPQPLADYLSRFIEEPAFFAQTKLDLSNLKAILGNRSPSQEVTEAILKILGTSGL